MPARVLSVGKLESKFPFLRYVFFLNADVTAASYNSLVRKLAETAGIITFSVGKRYGGVDVATRQHLFAHPEKYEMEFIIGEHGWGMPPELIFKKLDWLHDDVTRLENFQTKIRQTLNFLFDKRYAAVGLIISEFTRDVGVKVVGRDKESPPTLLPLTPYVDLRIWYYLALLAASQGWESVLGRCPIVGCSNRYFIKVARADQRFCSSAHRALWRMRARRGQDPATGKRLDVNK